MTGDADARDELHAAIEGLSDEQARTLLGWASVLDRQRRARDAAQSVGTLGDAFGIVTDIQEPGRSRMRLDVDPIWHNPNGVVHGGVIYTLIDYSMGSAVLNSLPAGQYCATIEVKISYLTPVREGTLTAETNVVKRGRNIAFTESRVADGSGRLVATASGSMFIIRPDQTQQQESS